ncbi:hypothetical protein PFISCL1PPCAC_20362, partial [Pristionchus fissidentatus]
GYLTHDEDGNERVTVVDGEQRVEAFRALRDKVNREFPGVYTDEPLAFASQSLSESASAERRRHEGGTKQNPFSHMIICVVGYDATHCEKVEIANYKSARKPKEAKLTFLQWVHKYRALFVSMKMDDAAKWTLKAQIEVFEDNDIEVRKPEMRLARVDDDELANIDEVGKLDGMNEKAIIKFLTLYTQARKVSQNTAQCLLSQLVEGEKSLDTTEKILNEHVTRVAYVLTGRMFSLDTVLAVSERVQSSKSAVSEIKKITNKRRRMCQETVTKEGWDQAAC